MELSKSPISLPVSPLFGTDGIRGKVGDILTSDLAVEVGFWSGQVLRHHNNSQKAIIIGQDPRNSSEMLAESLTFGLTKAGLEVWNLGLCPTPCVAYLSSIYDTLGGIMISASHNPPEDNGIKFFGHNGRKLPVEMQKNIENAIRGNADFTILNGGVGKHYEKIDLISNYTDALLSPLLTQIDLKGMKIVLDLAWGASVYLAPEMFKKMGAEVICLHDKPNGDRINVNCGSTHLQLLQKAVEEFNADLGFAFDGDADRVMAIDGNGKVIDGDYILYFWGKELKEKNQLPDDLIIATVMANLGFENAWKKLGGKMIRTNVGDQYVQAEMLKTGSMLGGEQSGHILCPHYSVSGDGILTALHLATMVKKSGSSLAMMAKESFETYPQILHNVRVDHREIRMNWHKCEPLKEVINQAEINMGDQGRVLVRASGTEPLIRVMVEGANSDITTYYTELLVNAVKTHLLG